MLFSFTSLLLLAWHVTVVVHLCHKLFSTTTHPIANKVKKSFVIPTDQIEAEDEEEEGCGGIVAIANQVFVFAIAVIRLRTMRRK